MTPEQLVSKFKADDRDQTHKVGKVSVHLTSIFTADRPTVQIEVNWPALGSVKWGTALLFADDLQTAARFASECESLLREAGYTIRHTPTI